MGKLRDQLVAAQVARETFEVRQAEIEQRWLSRDRDQSLTYLLAGIGAFYLLVRFGFTQRLDALGDHAAYLFELSLIAFTCVLLRPRFSIRALMKPLTLLAGVAALIAGFATLKLARLTGVAVPFNVHDRETVAMLLAGAPLLEEGLFRFMLFKPLERIFSSGLAVVATSLMFSYSHLHAIWFVPAEYDKFIIYQALYTLPLAFACGWMVRRQRSLLSAVLVHMLFNLGFFLAFWF